MLEGEEGERLTAHRMERFVHNVVGCGKGPPPQSLE